MYSQPASGVAPGWIAALRLGGEEALELVGGAWDADARIEAEWGCAGPSTTGRCGNNSRDQTARLEFAAVDRFDRFTKCRGRTFV